MEKIMAAEKKIWRDCKGRFQPGNQQTRGRRKVSNAKFIECAKKCGGIVTALANLAGIDRCTAMKYLNEIPDAKAQFESQKETIIDLAENQLVNLVKQGDKDAIFFLLKTVGKRRGYSEKTETELSGGIGIDTDFDIIIENN